MPTYTNVNGICKTSSPSVNVNGVWRNANSNYVNVNGVWRDASSGIKINTDYSNEFTTKQMNGDKYLLSVALNSNWRDKESRVSSYTIPVNTQYPTQSTFEVKLSRIAILNSGVTNEELGAIHFLFRAINNINTLSEACYYSFPININDARNITLSGKFKQVTLGDDIALIVDTSLSNYVYQGTLTIEIESIKINGNEYKFIV